MANEEHIRIVLGGSKAIGEWQNVNPDETLDLRKADLRRIDLVRASLPKANFTGAFLEWADFRWADLMAVDFSEANLARADFHKADMQGAILRGTILHHTNLEDANLRSAQFDNARFGHTRILNSDLVGATGLISAVHAGPSTLDSETIQKSGPLPVAFLRGCGVNDDAIQSVIKESSRNLAIDLQQIGPYYSVFISYASKNSEFVDRLYADLQSNGVRCWYAPEDMKIGGKILDSLYEGIRTHEKLLLVLSKYSVQSDWVEDEVNKAFAEERDRGQPIVFPVRLDDTVMTADQAWAQKIRDDRHIGDFRNWNNPQIYSSSIERLLRDLQR
jgi:hypothetical protein